MLMNNYEKVIDGIILIFIEKNESIVSDNQIKMNYKQT